MSSDHLEADVAIVGGGLAGLAAARALAAAGSTAVVLEARDRVGGRLLNGQTADGVAVELGGQWIGPTQDRAAALVRSLGLETFPTHTAGQNLLEMGGRIRRYSGTIPRMSPPVLIDIALAQRKVARLAAGVDPEAPWGSPGADRLDAQSFASWMDRHVRTRRARRLFALAGKTVWGAEPADLSLLHLLFYVRSAGSLDMLFDTEGGAQQDRVVGGSQLIASRLAEELEDRVRLGRPVRRIERRDGRVRVVADGATVDARRAIVAVPPPLAGRIEHDPPLPALREQVNQRMAPGALIKCMAVYAEPFWRADGLSGEALSDSGPATLTFDNSPPGGAPGVLLGFLGGSEALRLSGAAGNDRRRAVVDGFVRLFGDRAANPDAYLEQDWTVERWSLGGPTCNFGPGGWTACGMAVREAIGPLHWAGTETATRWCGYMDGAISSGERAASEALAALG